MSENFIHRAGLGSFPGQYYDAETDLHQNYEVIDANGYLTQYAYDNVGRVTQVASWDSGTTNYAYHPDGTLQTRTDGWGVTATYAYDASARLTGVSYPNPSENRSYTYDAVSSSFGLGRLTGSTDPSGTTTYRYDAMGRLSAEEKTILVNKHGNYPTLGSHG